MTMTTTTLPVGEGVRTDLATWLVIERITVPARAPESAARLRDALGGLLDEWATTGNLQALRAAARGIADLDALGDAGWAAENFWHGHDEGAGVFRP
jgi:hypothetical protein